MRKARVTSKMSRSSSFVHLEAPCSEILMCEFFENYVSFLLILFWKLMMCQMHQMLIF